MRAIMTITLAAALGLAGCAGESVTEVSQRIDEKRFALAAPDSTFAIGFLEGTLSDLRVVQRVNAETGDVISPPQLRGTLLVKNVSEDQAARVVAGRVAYLDGTGARIALADGRAEPALQIYGYSGDRLDPGDSTTHSLDMPFPASALEGDRLAEVRLDLTYIPMPYRSAAGRVAVSVTPAS